MIAAAAGAVVQAAAGAVVQAAAEAVGGEGVAHVKKFIGSGWEKINCGNNLERNYEGLMQKAAELWKLLDFIDTKISKYRIKLDTAKWIAEVKMMKNEVTELETKFSNENQSPQGRGHVFKHSDLSKDMAEKCELIGHLLKEGRLKRDELVAELPEPVRNERSPKIEDNSSQHEVVEGVLSWLKDEEVRKIGIWGMVGIGKTTIMKNLNNHDDIRKMFDLVILVAVSEDWSPGNLQHQIMRRLKLNVGNTVDIHENARIISEELEAKKCLILLDEVFDFIDLDEIMKIHDNQDSKVVFASRARDICKVMDADELIQVKCLSDQEAFNMFNEIVGLPIHSRGIEAVAWLVVKECGRLPLLIETVAKTFKKKGQNDSLWRAELKKLQWQSPKNNKGINEIINFLKYSYDNLDGDAEKFCFLYSALYLEEYDICKDYLIECWRAGGLIPEYEYVKTFRDARDEGVVILNNLINVSFLVCSENIKCVKMNKVLRHLALEISSETEGFKFLAMPGRGLQVPPDKEKWKGASHISLMDNKLGTLPERPACSKLVALLLQRNKNLLEIPKSFCKSMRHLLVLDLHGTGIESLPWSLSCLTCLRGLYLNSCSNLVQLPTNIEALVKLEVLDIRGTKIDLLQLRSLIWLKCLRISLSNFGRASCTEKKVSSFVLLEEFSVDIDSSSKEWWNKNLESIAEEVATLENLTSLQFCFLKVECLNLFVESSPAWKKDSYLTPFQFQFSVGYHDPNCFRILESYPINNGLKLVNGEGVNKTIQDVLMKTNVFGLINHKRVSTWSGFGMENMHDMSVCLIDGCNEIKTIIDANGIEKSVLERLAHLHINNLLKLESIWQGPIHAGSLGQLKSLTLIKCPELKKIFSKVMINQLPKLEDLRVEECHQLEEIIIESENNGLEASALPRLKTLVLLDLPKLASIWVDDSLEWRSLQKVKISLCAMLKSLPFKNAAKLRSVEGQHSWWQALEWKDNAIKQRLESVCFLN